MMAFCPRPMRYSVGSPPPHRSISQLSAQASSNRSTSRTQMSVRAEIAIALHQPRVLSSSDQTVWSMGANSTRFSFADRVAMSLIPPFPFLPVAQMTREKILVIVLRVNTKNTNSFWYNGH